MVSCGGFDSPNTIHVNFGQQPFKYDHVIDELFSECVGINALAARQMLQNANKARFHSVRRNCIDAFIANILERRRLTTAFAAGMATSLFDLGDELLVHVLSFAAPRDVESLTVASPLVARDVVPWFPPSGRTYFAAAGRRSTSHWTATRCCKLMKTWTLCSPGP
ncbi:hypothetical protein GQ600_12556 [Phytophthora cactorum]|nr:hypothetical protein GQ600_12556 [Phytophthora cactorum]